MNRPNYYFNLPHDLSGSRSKNRFRSELLWGICKMLDLMEDDKDFAIVFDYVCDIEVHFENGFEFYQIKTQKNGTPAFTYKSLTKKASKNTEGSILGKLYLLNKSNEKEIKLALVSNAPYNCDGKRIDDEIICFDTLPDTEKDKLQKALCKELCLETIDLSGIYYLHTELNLRDPELEVQGKIVISFERIKHCEPQNPRALYRLIFDTVSEKACYEFPVSDYESLLQKKGITREEFDRMLDCHSINEKTGIKQTQEYIDSLDNINTKRKYKQSLVKLLHTMPTNKILREIEKKIGLFLLDQDEIGPIESALELLIKQFHGSFPIEYSNADKTVFYIIIVFRFEEGVYDDENGF